MQLYANPEVLVSTDWVDQHRADPGVVIAEVDVDTNAYNEGHVPGAIGWNWQTQLCDVVRRDIISKEDLEKLLSLGGVSNDTMIVLYGDNNNWFAAWAFWQLKMYGHNNVRIMNGGRKKWLAEGRGITKDAPQRKTEHYKISDFHKNFRALRPQVEEALHGNGSVLVDVRSNDEFTGKILSPPGLPETCQRGGHIPGAKNIPWGLACNNDGTFKSQEELKALYEEKGVTPDKNVIAYCRIGERSSHTWFVLKYLLGFKNVSNYDGSWTEWGNMVGAPVEKGA
ncbi:MAG: sulfurtransferase [Ignavibacteriae bacterium]|nr:sulfurtransferase [Ignavibacteria bacterium]MBI3364233.1 sulfurtransferase [Ignavibacteriota bacterium]